MFIRTLSALFVLCFTTQAYALGTECWTYEYCSQTGCGMKCSDATYYPMDCGADIFDNGFDIHESGGCNGVDPNSYLQFGGFVLFGLSDPAGAQDTLAGAGVDFATAAELSRVKDLGLTRAQAARAVFIKGDLASAQRLLRRARIRWAGGLSLNRR